MNGKNILDDFWENIQETINKNGYTDQLAPNKDLPLDLPIKNPYDPPNTPGPNGPNILWTREYFEKCPEEKESQPIVIVGHCPTTYFPGLCPENIGCVALRCKDDHDYPKVVMVDTALSQAFHDDSNQTRDVEILKLSKAPEGSVKFYKIERQLNGNVIDTPTPPATSVQIPPTATQSKTPLLDKLRDFGKRFLSRNTGGSRRKPKKYKIPRTRKRIRRSIKKTI
jgi:hypothetical protein